MKILEQNSTRLLLQDSPEILWMTKIMSIICLTWSAGNLIRGIVVPSSLSFLVISHIVFSFVLSIGFASLSSKNTVTFDKTLKKLRLVDESALKTKIVEYPLEEIIEVKAAVKIDPEGNSYNIILNLASNAQAIQLSQTNFISADNAKESAELIRNFLNLPE